MGNCVSFRPSAFACPSFQAFDYKENLPYYFSGVAASERYGKWLRRSRSAVLSFSRQRPPEDDEYYSFNSSSEAPVEDLTPRFQVQSK